MLLLATLIYVYLGFKAWPQVQVVDTNGVPVFRFLINIKSAADFDDPTGVKADFAVVEAVVKFPFKLNTVFGQTVLEQPKAFLYRLFLQFIVKTCDEMQVVGAAVPDD